MLLPFVVVVFLEALRDGAAGRQRRWIELLQGLIFFCGVFTDWLMVFVALVVYLKRLLAGDINRRSWREFATGSLGFAAGPVAGVAAFILYLLVVMWGNWRFAVDYIRDKYLGRAGFAADDRITGWEYLGKISRHIDQGYSFYGRTVVAFMVLFVVLTGLYLLKLKISKAEAAPEVKKMALLSLILVAPCLLQIFLFLNHSAVHSFSVLKLSLPIALVPFVLLPLTAGMLLRDHLQLGRSRFVFAALMASLLLSGFYLTLAHGGSGYFALRNDYWYRLVDAVQRHTQPGDIVFSPELEIPYYPPQPLSLAMKRVYRAKSLRDVAAVQSIPGDYRVVLIFSQKPRQGSAWYRALATADSSLEDGAFYLYFSLESIRRLSDRGERPNPGS